MNLIAANAVLAVHNHPHCGHPLVETDGGILHDRSGFQGELRCRMLGATVPPVVLLQEQNILARAARAGNAVRPAARDKVFAAVGGIGEVYDCLLKGVRFGCHDSTLKQNSYFVNYIIALISGAEFRFVCADELVRFQ